MIKLSRKNEEGGAFYDFMILYRVWMTLFFAVLSCSVSLITIVIVFFIFLHSVFFFVFLCPKIVTSSTFLAPRWAESELWQLSQLWRSRSVTQGGDPGTSSGAETEKTRHKNEE